MSSIEKVKDSDNFRALIDKVNAVIDQNEQLQVTLSNMVQIVSEQEETINQLKQTAILEIE